MNEDGPELEVTNHTGRSGAKAWQVYSRSGKRGTHDT